MSSINLNKDSVSVKYLCAKDKHLAKVIQMIGPIEYQIPENSYDFLVHEIIGQMLSNKVDDLMTNRLRKLCHEQLTPKAVTRLSDDDIFGIGISHSKVNYIRNLTSAIQDQTIDFSRYPAMSDQAVIDDLTQIKGIGQWSAKMYLMFCLDRPDILPYEDIAFLQGYGWVYKTDNYDKKLVQKKCRKWHPYSSIAARYLYRALDQGLTKQTFHLYK